MNPFQAQQQIRNNATEVADYLSDLKVWKNDMDKKEKNVKQNDKKNKKNNEYVPPIRNQTLSPDAIKKKVSCFCLQIKQNTV